MDTSPNTDYQDKLHQEAVRRETLIQQRKSFLLSRLKELGIARVTAEYDGEGDSGQTGDVIAYNAADDIIDLHATSSFHFEEHGTSVAYKNLEEFIDMFLWDILWQNHEGFENNDGGRGTLTIRADDGTAELEHADRFVDEHRTFLEV